MPGLNQKSHASACIDGCQSVECSALSAYELTATAVTHAPKSARQNDKRVLLEYTLNIGFSEIPTDVEQPASMLFCHFVGEAIAEIQRC